MTRANVFRQRSTTSTEEGQSLARIAVKLGGDREAAGSTRNECQALSQLIYLIASNWVCVFGQ